eukprot:TRINITY_DN79337_c0_g1_i1.p1 TRINITY_DN79337_c0_g1~~TRINITY_DN79337_c0_g1_i1.p1  ORF type:complete len:222 (+),score=17.36 TRINITY_DN79337_c0_g1_i1:122-787(+)
MEASCNKWSTGWSSRYAPETLSVQTVRKTPNKPTRTEWVYDPAVMATHDRLNGVLRSQLDCWHVPRTTAKQDLLHSTSQIVDTSIRQKIARQLNKQLKESTNGSVRSTISFAETGVPGCQDGRPGTLRFRHDGVLHFPKETGLRRCMSASSVTRIHDPDDRVERWLPPWTQEQQFARTVGPSAPRWAATEYAATAPGPALWAGASVPAKARIRDCPRPHGA